MAVFILVPQLFRKVSHIVRSACPHRRSLFEATLKGELAARHLRGELAARHLLRPQCSFPHDAHVYTPFLQIARMLASEVARRGGAEGARRDLAPALVRRCLFPYHARLSHSSLSLCVSHRSQNSRLALCVHFRLRDSACARFALLAQGGSARNLGRNLS